MKKYIGIKEIFHGGIKKGSFDLDIKNFFKKITVAVLYNRLNIF